MGFDSIIRRFLPREERFQEILAHNTGNLTRAVTVFVRLAEAATLEERRVLAVELKAVERDGDTITARLFDVLNSTFITPFDREDIRAMATDLDDILDYCEAVGQQMVLFEMADSPAGLRQFAGILQAMVAEVKQITDLVWNLDQEPAIRQCAVRISDLENQADALYATVMADLFKKSAGNPVDILKWKEVYEGLENACDACKDYGHVIGNIVTKNT